MKRIFTERMIYMLKYDEFKEMLINRIKDYVPEKYKAYDIEVTKVNKINESLDALCLINKNKKVNTSPVVYIDNMYNYYTSCKNIDMVLKKAADIITEGFNMVTDKYVYDKNIKDNIVLVLINAQANKELLKTIPHIRFLDLAFVFRWIITKNEYGFSGSIINNSLAKNIDLDTDEMFELAKANTMRLLPPKVITLKNALKAMNAPKNLLDNTPEYPVFVLSNIYCVEAAAYIAFDDILSETKNKLNENFYILPSSINEALIIPESFVTPEFVREMVWDVNNTVISKTDKLSDSIYFYDGDVKIMQ